MANNAPIKFSQKCFHMYIYIKKKTLLKLEQCKQQKFCASNINLRIWNDPYSLVPVFIESCNQESKKIKK